MSTKNSSGCGNYSKPGSVIEQMKIIDPLTNPTAHGGKASDAFDVVIPSMPGYGYSGKPATTGWDPAHIRAAAIRLQQRRGLRVPDGVAPADVVRNC